VIPEDTIWVIMEVIHEHLNFTVGVRSGSRLNGANFVEGGFDARVDVGVVNEGAVDCLDASGTFFVKRR
jgi:hypothetical protein